MKEARDVSFTRWWVTVQLGILGLAVLFPMATLQAQGMKGQGEEEIRLMREAEALEAAGDFVGAERVLREILDARPTAVGTLIALERVLRVQGRVADVLGPVTRLLEADPRSAITHRLKLKILSELNRVDELDRAAEAWIAATPKLEAPYRETAAIWAERGDHARAVKVLERGRSAVGRGDALALELGDAYARVARTSRAIEEWDRAIGEDGRGYTLVRRRLGELPDGGAPLLPGLIDALTRNPTTLARRRVATELAIDAGLTDRAERIAASVAAELPPSEKEAFFVEIARKADGKHLRKLAYWAYREILKNARDDEPHLALRTRLAELALAVGDTTTARENFRIIEEAYAAGSPERREATAMRIELTAREGNVEQALHDLESFRREYSDGPELDRLVAALGEALLRTGDVARVEQLLGTVRGPRTSLLRGRVALQKGQMSEARRHFMSAAPGLEGAEATEILSLVTLLGKLTPAGGELLGRAMARAMQGDVPGAITLLADESEHLDRRERSAVLDFAAALSDRTELYAESERIRRMIVMEYPDAPEAPAALLLLGRSLARRPGEVAEAEAVLERLVLDYPRSPLVPQARRELERLRTVVPRS